MRDTRQFLPEAQWRNGAKAASPSIAELISVGLCGAPCCGYIELCDGLCRDVMSSDEDKVQLPRLKPR